MANKEKLKKENEALNNIIDKDTLKLGQQLSEIEWLKAEVSRLNEVTNTNYRNLTKLQIDLQDRARNLQNSNAQLESMRTAYIEANNERIKYMNKNEDKKVIIAILIAVFFIIVFTGLIAHIGGLF